MHAMHAMIAAIALCSAGAGCARACADEPKAMSVAATKETIALDGELEEAAWKNAARTRAFVDEHGAPARPFSEARFLHDASALYLALYAADENIVAHDDAFSIELGDAKIDVDAAGTTHWNGGMRVGIDCDGTIDDPSDDDEEWVVEAAVPLASIAAAKSGALLPIKLSRCDTVKSGERRCGEFHRALRLE